MQGLRGAAHSLALLNRTRSLLPSLTAWHVNNTACLNQNPVISAFLQSQSRTITQQPLQSGNERVVVLGTGWAAMRLAKDLDTTRYDLTVNDRAVPNRMMSAS